MQTPARKLRGMGARALLLLLLVTLPVAAQPTVGLFVNDEVIADAHCQR